MNILFVTSAAPQKSPFFTDEKRPPLGLGSLMALARAKGNEVHFIDTYLSPSRFIEEGFLQKNKIDLMGVYANTICWKDTLRMFHAAERLRMQGSWHGKIAVGGPHTSVALDTIPGFVDHVVQGEGEEALSDICEKQKAPRVIKKERMKVLDHLPFQPWDIFVKQAYDFSCPWMDERPVFTMNTSRGCPYDCSFCSVGTVWGTRYAALSAQRIIDEISYVVKYHGARGIYFREDNFTCKPERVREFCRLIGRGTLRIPWACESRVDALCQQDVVRDMSVAGCKAVYLGVESGSQRLLDQLKKGITVAQIEKAVTLCKINGIRTYCSLLAGVPGERYADLLASKKLMQRLKPYTHSFNVFVGIPRSILYDQAISRVQYEHIDDVGLLYLPGFNVMTEYFYRKNSHEMADFDFKGRTPYTRRLEVLLLARKIREVIGMHVPEIMKKWIKKIALFQ